MEYNGIADEEIIIFIRNGDKEAMDYLLQKYKNLVRKKAKTLYITGGDRDDIIQEGMIGLYKAIQDYKHGLETSFFTFANLCISRQIYTAMNSSNTKKNQPLNNYISFELSKEEEDNDISDKLLSTGKQFDPEEEFIDKEYALLLENTLLSRLSKLEKEVLSLYLNDNNYIEIAAILKKEPKVTDNALQRIRRKLSQVLSELS